MFEDLTQRSSFTSPSIKEIEPVAVTSTEKPEPSIGEIKFERQGKEVIAKVLILQYTSESIKPFFRLLANYIASGITFGSLSRSFKAKAVHAYYDLGKIWAKHYFKEDLAFEGARNIARKKILENQEDYIASEKLFEQCKKFNKDLDINYSKKPEAQIVDGICAGIRLDIAERHIIKKESILEIMKSGEKGASAEAAANQAVYNLLDAKGQTIPAIFDQMITHLEKISKSEGAHELSHVDAHEIGQALIILDGDVRTEKEYEDFKRKFNKTGEKPGDEVKFSGLMHEMLNQAKKDASQLEKQLQPHPFLANNNGVWEISNFAEFQKAATMVINTKFTEDLKKQLMNHAALSKKRLENLNALKWTVSLLEFKQGLHQGAKENFSVISDPVIRHMLDKHISQVDDDKKYGAVAKARGLKLVSVADLMGDSSLHNDDASFLRNLPKLPEGVYAIDLYRETGAHAITYVKESDGQGYIMDPNGYQIRCNSPDHAIILLQKVLSMYDEPKDKTPSSVQKGPDHQLSIARFEKI